MATVTSLCLGRTWIDMKRIRYSYKPSNFGIQLAKVKCPVCGNPINGTEILQDYSFNGKVVLLAECWSGKLHEEKPRHEFLIEIEDIPIVKIKKV